MASHSATTKVRGTRGQAGQEGTHCQERHNQKKAFNQKKESAAMRRRTRPVKQVRGTRGREKARTARRRHTQPGEGTQVQ